MAGQKIAAGHTTKFTDFQVGHNEHGVITFEGETDLEGLDLSCVDQIVVFGPRKVEVYPEEGTIEKPEKGLGLNKSAIIELHKVFPKGDQRDASSLANERERLRKKTEKLGAEFLAYTNEGTWRFRVEDFC